MTPDEIGIVEKIFTSITEGDKPFMVLFAIIMLLHKTLIILRKKLKVLKKQLVKNKTTRLSRGFSYV
ncbi:hypothetical protein [Bacillus thuringiensis]|uniref:hypothetical protein n=1 Tax=Bacillus thuringiensis TaxID=1428 RepID=UPI002DBFF696|nr:hypothetical protein [Bacillus thuringiensis]MEC3316839.1 hypothetical protein [Bacillus thuringiensis]